jgi:hypothetical protein
MSDETRDFKPSSEEIRRDAIQALVGLAIDEIFDESPGWYVGGGEEPKLWEVRDAVLQKLFTIEHEFGRQSLYAEQVIENCL